MLRIAGAVHTPAVAEAIGQAVEADVPVVPGAIAPRVQLDLGGIVAIQRLKHELDRQPVPAQQREVDAAADLRGPQRHRPAPEDFHLHAEEDKAGTAARREQGSYNRFVSCPI